MIDLGVVKPGSTVRIPFNTFDSNDPSASVTVTNLAAGDVEIHKDGSATQRASDAGVSVSIDFDTVTGQHFVIIDLSDNTTAGFYAAGSIYNVRVEGITVDAGTLNSWIGRFEIGYRDAILNTTIATLSSQTSFTLTAGPGDNDALNGCPVLVHDVASAVQIAIGYVSDYVGSTKTVTLAADPSIFTMAATDNISFFIPTPLVSTVSGAVGSVTGNVGGNVTGSVGSLATQAKADVNAECDTALTDYDGVVPADLPANFGDLVITATTGQMTVGTNNDKTGYSISGTKTTLDALNDVSADNIHDEVIENSLTFRQITRIILAALSGKLSGAATTTIAIRDNADSKDRISATVDSDGNRSAVTLDGT